MVLKLSFLILPLFSLFWFPWPMTLLMMVLAGFIFPPFAFFVGALAEILFGGLGVPYALISGICIALITYAVRVFLKARIM